MDKYRAVIAAVVFLIFVIFGYFLVKEADTASSESWERWVYVFGAAEAIAFAAIGWLFGREVNRERAEKAEDKADEAQAKAQEELQKGSTLAGMVRTAAGGKPGVETMGAGGGNPSLAPAVEYVANEYNA
jgi:hypothetical protein